MASRLRRSVPVTVNRTPHMKRPCQALQVAGWLYAHHYPAVLSGRDVIA